MLIGSDKTTECALVKLRLSEKPSFGAEYSSCLQKVWEQEKMQSFDVFWRWYNSKNVFPTLEAMQKMVEVFHKGIGTPKFGFTILNLANICLNSSFSSKFYPFTENDKDVLSKVR